jgi:hypothetical protein
MDKAESTPERLNYHIVVAPDAIFGQSQDNGQKPNVFWKAASGT